MTVDILEIKNLKEKINKSIQKYKNLSTKLFRWLIQSYIALKF